VGGLARLTVAAAALVAHPTAMAASDARDFPMKPVRVLVGSTPGGAADTIVRTVTLALTDLWGSTALVDNRAGAGGGIANETVARAAPDGYTLLHCTIGSHAIAPALKKLTYDHIRDFAPISMIGSVPNVLVVHPSMPAKTMREFIAHAKANPGKVSFGTSGIGVSPHLSIELLKSMAGIDIVHVPYKGAAIALSDVMGGQIPAASATLPGAPLAAIRSGRLRALGVTTAKRNKQAPDVPTFAEGGVPGFDVSSWHGFCAPAGLPKPILAKLNADMIKVLNSPQLRQRLEDQGFEVTPTSPEQFMAHIRSESVRWEKIIRSAGLKQE